MLGKREWRNVSNCISTYMVSKGEREEGEREREKGREKGGGVREVERRGLKPIPVYSVPLYLCGMHNTLSIHYCLQLVWCMSISSIYRCMETYMYCM